MNKYPGERGQALVIIILAIVAIFGFSALAVDVGRTYSERRRAQNAADAAAYASAFAATQGDDYRAAGRNSILYNGYDDTDLGPNPDDKTDVQIYNPPISGKYSVATETIKPIEYFQVFITSDVDKVFSQFVYNGPMAITVEAIARSTGSRSFAGGAAIVATCPDCCEALQFRGNSEINVTDGNIISNSDPDDCESGARQDAPTCVNVENGEINLGGEFSNHENSNCEDENGNPVPGVIGDINENSTDLWSGTDPGVPGCESLGLTPVNDGMRGMYNNVGTEPNNPYVLNPGIYPKGMKISGANSVVSLAPGMYCLDDDLEVSAGSLLGDGVMLVMRGDSSISINTDSPVALSAPAEDDECIPDDTISPGFCWSGFLVYMPYSNKGTVFFAGGNTTTYTGTIYAPGPAKRSNDYKCTILGNGEELGLNASLICYTIDIGGTGTIDIDYYDKINAQSPAIIELTK